tara:strand:+ start:5223 stop:6491 length:1269 start_codon:yes stop_codon:yes gene_type:complete
MLKGNKNKFTKAKGGHPYDEPTFLSFFLIFDWTGSGSPLFNGKAAAFLRDVYGDEARAQKLEQFIKYLKKINLEMPWFWQSITGLEAAHTYGALKDPYGFADAKIEIDCLDTLDFTIAGIFDLYRSCVIDTNRYVEVLPGNLRKFRVYVHVQEIRNFVPFIGADSNVDTVKKLAGMSGADRKAALDSVTSMSAADGYKMMQDRLDSDVLDWKAKGMGPRFVTRLDNCKFDWDNGSKMFSEISNVDISAPVKHKMCFYYQGARISEVEYLTAFNYKDADPLSPFDNDILNDLANKGMAAAVDAGNQIITAGTAAAERALDNLKGKLLLGNVYGANTLSNLQDAFNAGSINAIKPLVSGEDERDISSGAGGSIGDNLIPDTSPEIDLKSTNIFPQSENERALTPDNVYPPKSSENDERLGNINE